MWQNTQPTGDESQNNGIVTILRSNTLPRWETTRKNLNLGYIKMMNKMKGSKRKKDRQIQPIWKQRYYSIDEFIEKLRSLFIFFARI